MYASAQAIGERRPVDATCWRKSTEMAFAELIL